MFMETKNRNPFIRTLNLVLSNKLNFIFTLVNYN